MLYGSAAMQRYSGDKRGCRREMRRGKRNMERGPERVSSWTTTSFCDYHSQRLPQTCDDEVAFRHGRHIVSADTKPVPETSVNERVNEH